MSPDPAILANAPVAGRECGTCTLCCKVFDVPVLEKPAGQWCAHCKPGHGCTIHLTRPDQCRDYQCFWLLAPFLDPEWKPDKARFVLTVDAASQFLLVQLDPGQPLAWKKQPYYGQLKQWATAGLGNGRQVLVFLNKAATVVLPNKDVDLGVIAPGERVVVTSRPLVGGGFEFDAHKAGAQ